MKSGSKASMDERETGDKPSLVLVTIDCLRADHVGFLGYGKDTTPHLDRLSGESLVFEKALVAGSPTYYSFLALMASRYPLAMGRDVIGLVPAETTLGETLQDADRKSVV